MRGGVVARGARPLTPPRERWPWRGTARHFSGRAQEHIVCKLQAGDGRVQEHYQLCGQQRFALLVDHLDGTNLVSIESKVHRLRTIGFARMELAREGDARVVR